MAHFLVGRPLGLALERMPAAVVAARRRQQQLVDECPHRRRQRVGDLTVVRVVNLFAGGDREAFERAERRQLVRSEEHTSELQSLMRISYAVFCLTKKKQ